MFTRYYRDILSYTSKRCASGLELSRGETPTRRALEPSSRPNIYVLFNRLGARAFRTGATIPSTPLSSCQWWSGRDFVGGASMGKLCCGRKHAGTVALWPHREFSSQRALKPNLATLRYGGHAPTTKMVCCATHSCCYATATRLPGLSSKRPYCPSRGQGRCSARSSGAQSCCGSLCLLECACLPLSSSIGMCGGRRAPGWSACRPRSLR